MSVPTRLIVNADDLGRTEGINRGVFEAHRRGIVTSASLMVNYPAARSVPAMSRDHPRLGIGLHVALTGGPPALPAGRLPSLVDAAGRLPPKPEGLAGANPREIQAEARAQLDAFRALMGREPTHFDSHHHSHRLAPVLAALIELARENGRPVRTASAGMAEQLRSAGVRSTDFFLDEFYDRTATREALFSLLQRLEPGTTELMCHPAVVDDELRASSGYAEPRAQELAALIDPGVRQLLEAEGVRLIHFGEL